MFRVMQAKTTCIGEIKWMGNIGDKDGILITLHGVRSKQNSSVFFTWKASFKNLAFELQVIEVSATQA